MSARSIPLHSLDLLVVDRDETQRVMVAKLLASAVNEGRIVDATPDVAVKMLAEKRFDSVLVGIDASGDRAVVEALRAANESVAILAIVDNVDACDDLLEAGGNDFIVRSDMTAHHLGRRLRFVIRAAKLESDERQARSEAERAAHAREEILAVVSHDLRNPLNAISIAVQELSDPRIDDETRARYVAAILRSTARAERLIRDLMCVAMIDSGRLVIEPRPLNLTALLRQAARDHELMAQNVRMSIELQLDEALGSVSADRDRILQVLGNLIGNALNHARGSGTVTIAAEPAAGERVRVSVIDRGPGIAADALPMIFDRYWQASRSGRARTGIGLGLAIAKSIVELHGGALSVESEAGKGTAFRFTLPAA
jgi:signal transduction histidine kinase